MAQRKKPLYKMNKSIPQILKGTCVDLSFEGKGVFKSNKDVVFVDGMFPGEEGEVEITYRRNGALFGKIKKLNSPYSRLRGNDKGYWSIK